MTDDHNNNNRIVSSDQEELILVNSLDEELGYNNKFSCHAGDGILHRAFSIFIFNDLGELLIQKRSAKKLLWPQYWSNSCCSHPRYGEDINSAAQRRLNQELGLKTKLRYLYKFQYHAQYHNIGSEHELCYVFLGQCQKQSFINIDNNINNNEIEAVRFINAIDLACEINDPKATFTPWFKLEWQKMITKYNDILQEFGVSLI